MFLMNLLTYWGRQMECFNEREWLKRNLEEIFTPPTKNWDELRLWVYRFGDDWDVFLIELTIPKLLEELDGASLD